MVKNAGERNPMRTKTMIEETGSGSGSSNAESYPTNALGSYAFEELEIGLSASFEKTMTTAMIEAFAELSGDNNPIHVDNEYAAGTRFGECIAHGVLTGTMMSTIFGTQLPGVGCIYVSQTYNFRAPVKAGDHVVATVTVRELIPSKNRVIFDCVCRVDGKDVVTGEAVLLVPASKGELT